MLQQEDQRLVYSYDSERVWIECWGPNALRVRATKDSAFPQEDWALEEPQPQKPQITVEVGSGTLTNGNIQAVITEEGNLTIRNGKGDTILEEYNRNRKSLTAEKCSALDVEAREFKPIKGGPYRLTARFESLDPNEKIFGMGQYQMPGLDLKGMDLELAHRNSQASVPFALSSLGYGFLWNNPAVGRAVFGKNVMSFESYSTKALDYWIVAGDSPAEIEEAYANVTGKVPMMPEYGLGFWQCKLRYQTQEELLSIAREYKARQLPIDLIVIDFFHWPLQGEWKFDPTYWPDPAAMLRELQSMKIELMVSIWPTVDKRSENYAEMRERGYLVRAERGVQTTFEFLGDTVHFDPTNPEARKYVWAKAKQNYHSLGIKVFWLDEAEPEYSIYDFDNYRYHRGPNVEIGNIYPVEYSRAFYEGLKQEGHSEIVNLVRCAWAGSQKYGALVWSGDIASSWSSFRNQLAAGLNMGIAGLPWWTTDIGGFHGGDPNDSAFRELFVRWFQWGTFCPVMRLHGDRLPQQPQHGTTGGAACRSGAPNEVWSYGDEVYEICKKYMGIREQLRDYTRGLMKEAHEKGTPLMRPLFYDFPSDKRCWEVTEQYMYGGSYMCCPVLAAGKREMTVYFPQLLEGTWTSFDGTKTYQSGQHTIVESPIGEMPVFKKAMNK